MKFFKKIEIAASNLLINLLKNKNDQVLIKNKTNVFNEKNISKILLLRHDRIGDIIISTPILKALKNGFPQIQFDILLSENNISAKDIAEPFVSSIYHYKKNIFSLLKLLRILRREKYDLIIDLFDEPSTTSSILIKLINSSHSLGLKKEKSYIYSHLVPLLDRRDNHIVIRTSKLLLPFNIDPNGIELSLEYNLTSDDKLKAEKLLGRPEKKIRLGINLSGSNRSKFWGVDNNKNFIDLVVEKFNDTEIILFGTKEYEHELLEIKKSNEAVVAPFANSVREYAAMLSTCNILISPDTAAIHFASALSIPIITLYSSVTKGLNNLPWSPFNTLYISVTTSSSSLHEIDPIKVLNAFVKLRNQLI